MWNWKRSNRLHKLFVSPYETHRYFYREKAKWGYPWHKSLTLHKATWYTWTRRKSNDTPTNADKADTRHIVPSLPPSDEQVMFIITYSRRAYLEKQWKEHERHNIGNTELHHHRRWKRREDTIATKGAEVAESSPQDKVYTSSYSCASTITTEGHRLGVWTMASFTFHLYAPLGLLLPTCTSCMQAAMLYNP
jgi:hypothetical protein